MSTHYIEEAERLADEVAVMAHGKIIARGRPAELIAAHAGRETAEVYGPPDRLAQVRAQTTAHGCRPPAGPAIAIVGAERAGDGEVPSEAGPARCLARGRIRAAYRGGGGVRRLEPAAITGVMSREVANFRTFWKATTFSSVLEPVVYPWPSGSGSARRSSTAWTGSSTSSSSAPGWSPPL